MARNKVLGAIAAVLLAACLAPGAALADDAALVAGEQAFGSSAGQESQIVVVFKPGTGKAKAARSTAKAAEKNVCTIFCKMEGKNKKKTAITSGFAR